MERTGKPTIVTLSDVAALARVSIGTASKALNDRPGISSATRDQVRRAATSLSYRPLADIRSEPGQVAVGVVVSMLDSHWVTPILAGVEDGLGIVGATVLISSPTSGVAGARSRVEDLTSRLVDGIVFVGSSTNPVPTLSDRTPLPVVYAYSPSDSNDDASFVPDNVMAGRLIGEHLIESGRSRIAFVNGDARFIAAQDRAEGLQAALGPAGLIGKGPLYGDWSELWGRRGTTALLQSAVDLDAVVAGADRVARGAMDVIRASGRQIPHDVAVAGFDNWDELAMNAWPPLTTIDMRLRDLGHQAGVELAGRIGGERTNPGTRSLPVRLVPRESSARLT